MNRIAATVFLYLLSGFLFFCPQAYGQETTSAVPMEEIVVTATRNSEEVRRVPANVSVITAKDIEKSGATSIVEVLEKLESIQVRTYSGNPSQAVIDLRGFGGDAPYGKTLVLLDGKRLNNPDMQSVNWLQTSLSNIERIEVIRGAGSVLYGDSAVAGVINIITKKGEGKPEVHASVIAGSYGLHDEQAGIQGSEGKVSYSFNGENQGIQGYRARSEFSSRGAGLNLGYQGSEIWKTSLALSYNHTDFELPGSLTKTQYEEDRRQIGNPDDDGENEDFHANLALEALFGDAGRFHIQFLYGYKEITANYPSMYSFSFVNLDSYGITPRYVLDRNIFNHKNKLTIGLDYYDEELDKDGFNDREHEFKNNTAEFSRQSLGFYVRNELNVLEELILTLGYRTERAEITGKETLTDGTIAIADTGKIHDAEAFESALTWLIGEKSKVFAKYATVFRYPFLDEQASYYGFAFDSFQTDLEMETGKTYEVGGSFFPFRNFSLDLTLYRIDMEDEISWDASQNINRNLDETRHEGIEFGASYLWEKVAKVYGQISYRNSEFRDGPDAGKNVPLVSEKLGSAGVVFYLPYGLELNPEVKYIGEAYQGGDNSNEQEKIDDYAIYNLFLYYRTAMKNLKLSAFVGVENLTDEEQALIYYSSYSGSSYYPLPGITVKGGISLKF